MRSDVVVARLRAVGRGALIALGVVLPFELTAPLARIGPLEISSVELFLYAAVALWAASLAAAWMTSTARMTAPLRALWWRHIPTAHWAAAAWAAALVASAVAAPAARPAAVKFMLRSLGGLALYAAAADLLRAPGAVRRTALAVSAGALLAAMAMLGEAYLPRAALALRPFHAQSFQVFGLVRTSGPFQYPNIAAMYLEACVPLLLAAGAVVATRQSGPMRPWLAATVVGALALLQALVLTASRTGLVTAVLVLGGVAFAARQAPALRRPALIAMGGLVALTAINQAWAPLLGLRMRFWQDGGWYRAAITSPVDQPRRLPAARECQVMLHLRNDGALVWPRDGQWPVAVSYHWIDQASGQLVDFEGIRTPLPHDVPPGGSASVTAQVWTPERPGRYLLWWDLVHERVTWFSDRGDPGRRDLVEVTDAEPSLAAARAAPVSVAAPPFPPEGAPLNGISRRTLWGAGLAAWRDHPLLGVGPDNFRHTYGRYLGTSDADPRLHANSLFVETLADLGGAGALALAALVVTLARAARRAAARPPARALALGVGAAMAAYLVHGTLDYFLEFTPTYGLCWLLAGMLVALGRPPAEAAP